MDALNRIAHRHDVLAQYKTKCAEAGMSSSGDNAKAKNRRIRCVLLVDDCFASSTPNTKPAINIAGIGNRIAVITAPCDALCANSGSIFARAPKGAPRRTPECKPRNGVIDIKPSEQSRFGRA